MVLFAIIHLVYLLLVIVAPSVALVLLGVSLWRKRSGSEAKRWRPVVVALFAAGLALGPVGYYSSFVEPFRIECEHVDVSLTPGRAGRAEIRVGVLSDIQTDAVTDYERRAVAILMEAQPDLILLPGDFFQGNSESFQRELPAFRELLGRLHAPAGVFAVSGNIDREDQLRALLVGTDITLLANEIVKVIWKDRIITLGGSSSPGFGAGEKTIKALGTASGSEDVRILLAHFPDWVLRLRPNARIDLVVSGHTHGGQVRLPLVGPLITFSKLPAAVAAGGLHSLDGRRVFVSRGIGWERGSAPRMRFLCPPEVTVLTLKNAR